MHLLERHDIFEPGDLTALVCIDHPETQASVIDQLASIEYKIHVGLFQEDIVLKLRSHRYDTILINQDFGGTPLRENPVVHAAVSLPISQRRYQFIVLVGAAFVTNDEMMAFILSVDLLVNNADITNLKPILRRAIARHKDFYQPLAECIKAARSYNV